MENGLTPRSKVNLHISSDGDFTFQGHLSEYEVPVIIEAWQQAQRTKIKAEKSAQAPAWFIETFGRFSGLFPLVMALIFFVAIIEQCSSTPSPQVQQQQEGWGSAY